MTAKELIEIIKKEKLQKALFHLENDFLEYFDEKFTTEEEVNAYLKELGLGEMKEVDNVCNSDEMYSVIFFKDHNIYLKLIGVYDSYGNYDHYYEQGIKEVKPETKQITVYN